MTDLDKEFEKATAYTFDDNDIERARLLIGHDEAMGRRELHPTATPVVINNWAHGLGDDNPLFEDGGYGETTRWGSQIAPNSIATVIGEVMYGDRMPEEVRKATKGLFRGIHVFVSGGSWEWFRPVFPGDTLRSYHGEETLEVKDSEFAGKSVIQIRRDVKFNQRGEVVGVYRILRVLTERKAARDRGKYNELEPASYTDSDIERIDAIYAAERPRGSEPRWYEDVKIGDEMQPMVKGPLTTTDVIAFHAGGYGFVPYGLPSGRLAYKNRKRIAPFYIKNEMGVPDVGQRLHWDSKWAQAIGNPMAYDYGVMRETYFHHMITDWGGDDAFVVAQDDSIRKFNYHGDTQFLTGKVVGKRVENGNCLVDLEMKMANQRDTETAYATATVAVPSREHGAVVMPNVPVELARRTTQMYTRHLELADEARWKARRAKD